MPTLIWTFVVVMFTSPQEWVDGVQAAAGLSIAMNTSRPATANLVHPVKTAEKWTNSADARTNALLGSLALIVREIAPTDVGHAIVKMVRVPCGAVICASILANCQLGYAITISNTTTSAITSSVLMDQRVQNIHTISVKVFDGSDLNIVYFL